jgi:hypothetical protein
MASPFSRRHRFWTYRFCLLVSLIFITCVGFASKFYQGPGEAWLNNSFSTIPYEIFWILLVAFVYPPASALWSAIAVCTASCLLEFLQLWHPPFLQALRATLPGRLILGTTFSAWDFPYYFIGSFLGWLWLRFLRLNLYRSKG